MVVYSSYEETKSSSAWLSPIWDYLLVVHVFQWSKTKTNGFSFESQCHAFFWDNWYALKQVRTKGKEWSFEGRPLENYEVNLLAEEMGFYLYAANSWIEDSLNNIVGSLCLSGVTSRSSGHSASHFPRGRRGCWRRVTDWASWWPVD